MVLRFRNEQVHMTNVSFKANRNAAVACAVYQEIFPGKVQPNLKHLMYMNVSQRW